MSGGHYDYEYRHLYYLSEYIDRDVVYFSQERVDEEVHPPLAPEVLAAMQDLARSLEKIAAVAKSLDYALSGDTNLDSFMEDYKKWKS